MQKIITLSGLILSSAIAISLNAIDQKTSTIFACLADPTSRDCSGILFDGTDTEISLQNLTPEARKNLAAFFQKSTATEIEDCKKNLETEHGLKGLFAFGGGKAMADTYDETLDELTALVLYRSTNRWISKHEEEAKSFFQREDVQKIGQKIAKSSAYNPSNELAELLPKELDNALGKDMLRKLYAQGKIGFLAYQWEMLKRW